MKKVIVFASLVLSLTGCVTTSGAYRITAINTDGVRVPVVMDVRGSHIYAARNTICSANPGAVVSIADKTTGKELSSESPYRCK